MYRKTYMEKIEGSIKSSNQVIEIHPVFPVALVAALGALAYLFMKRTDIKRPNLTDSPVEYWAIDENAEKLNPLECDLYLIVERENHGKVAIIWNRTPLRLSKNDLLLESKEAYTARYNGKTVELRKFKLKREAKTEELDEEERKAAMKLPDWITETEIPSFELSEIEKREIWNPKD